MNTTTNPFVAAINSARQSKLQDEIEMTAVRGAFIQVSEAIDQCSKGRGLAWVPSIEKGSAVARTVDELFTAGFLDNGVSADIVISSASCVGRSASLFTKGCTAFTLNTSGGFPFEVSYPESTFGETIENFEQFNKFLVKLMALPRIAKMLP